MPDVFTLCFICMNLYMILSSLFFFSRQELATKLENENDVLWPTLAVRIRISIRRRGCGISLFPNLGDALWQTNRAIPPCSSIILLSPLFLPINVPTLPAHWRHVRGANASGSLICRFAPPAFTTTVRCYNFFCTFFSLKRANDLWGPVVGGVGQQRQRRCSFASRFFPHFPVRVEMGQNPRSLPW